MMGQSTAEAKPVVPPYVGPDDGPSCPVVDPGTRHQMIARAAYFRAQDRGFIPGHEQEDWCVAEAEIDTVLNFGTAL
jgi:hypothetical protein